MEGEPAHCQQRRALAKAAVRIESDAFSDHRIDTLAILAGYSNKFEALGRMAHLWRTCTQREVYVLPETTVAIFLGPRGVEALIEAELGERAEGGIRIRGTKGRIEWLKNLRANASAGGRAAKERRLAIHKEPQTSSTVVAEGTPSGTSGQTGECQTEPQTEPQTSARGVPDRCPLTLTPSILKSPLPPATGGERAIEATGTDRLFARYWAAVPNKKAKQDAVRAFRRLKPTEEVLNRMLAALTVAKASAEWQKHEGMYIPYPAKWLRGGCWEDEATDLRPSSPTPATIKTAPQSIINPPSAEPAFPRKVAAV